MYSFTVIHESRNLKQARLTPVCWLATHIQRAYYSLTGLFLYQSGIFDRALFKKNAYGRITLTIIIAYMSFLVNIFLRTCVIDEFFLSAAVTEILCEFWSVFGKLFLHGKKNALLCKSFKKTIRRLLVSVAFFLLLCYTDGAHTTIGRKWSI